jgi:hypothetical protein
MASGQPNNRPYQGFSGRGSDIYSQISRSVWVPKANGAIFRERGIIGTCAGAPDPPTPKGPGNAMERCFGAKAPSVSCSLPGSPATSTGSPSMLASSGETSRELGRDAWVPEIPLHLAKLSPEARSCWAAVERELKRSK